MTPPVSFVLKYDTWPEGIGDDDLQFTLVYEGQLLSASRNNCRTKHKHAIRKQFHPQLRRVWELHLAHWFTENRTSRLAHSWKAGVPVIEQVANSYSRCGYRFVPLVSEGLVLACSLDILLLWRELQPGSIIQRGDIDNRLKTLFDALRIPDNCGEVANQTPSEGENPFFCLLQDDKLITEVKVRADTLLTPEPDKGEGQNTVKLIIGVTVRPIYLTEWNMNFAP